MENSTGSESPWQTDSYFDIAEIWSAIWQGRVIVFILTLLCSLLSIGVALRLPDTYKADALLAPASEAKQIGLANVAERLGGFASFAGLSGSEDAGQTDLALEVLQSRSFIIQFVRGRELESLLFSVDEKGGGIEPYANESESQIDKHHSTRKSAAPSDWDLVEKFRAMMNVSQDKRNGFVRLSVELGSPEKAQYLVKLLIQDVNKHIRVSDINEAKKSIQYLQDQLRKTSVAEMQTIFYGLIEQQMKKIMLAEIRDEYVFRVIDPPMVPEEKSGPHRFVIGLLGALGGGVFGVIIAMCRYAAR